MHVYLPFGLMKVNLIARTKFHLIKWIRFSDSGDSVMSSLGPGAV